MSDSLLNPHSALVYLMVIMSAADTDMTDSELRRIGDITRTLPIFEGFDEEELVPAAEECAGLLAKPDGLERVLTIIVASLPAKLAATAYLIACEIAAADHRFGSEEIAMLRLIRNRLDVDKLTAAAVERAVMARNQRL